jgi:hypothetical protein
VAKTVRSDGPLRVPDYSESGTDFTHAELQFHRVDHSGLSMQVRVYLNNEEADESTPRDSGSGYAGTFHIFGHAGCFGEPGHCDVGNRGEHPFDYRLPHPLEPTTMLLEVTDAVKRLRSTGASEIGVTLVPVPYPTHDSLIGDDASEELKLDSISLVMYETSFDEGAG